MIQDIYNNFAKYALTIKGFQLGSKEDVPYDITLLANEYVDALDKGDNVKQNQYISALMIRYWHMVPLLYEKSKTLKVTHEDMVDWLYEAFEKAFKYRSWLDPNKSISKDPKGAEKCFNQCITSVRQWWFKHLNQDKRKINATLYSLDCSISEDDNGNVISLIDTIPTYDDYQDLKWKNYISCLIRDNKIFDALVIDGILNQDTFIEKTNSYTHVIENNDGELEEEEISSKNVEFSRRKLGSHLKNLSPEFIQYFINNYSVSRDLIEEEVMKIGSYKKHKLVSEISKSLLRLQNDKEVLSALCY